MTMTDASDATSITYTTRINKFGADGQRPERYVLCIPRACGFNDVLCQIWRSHEYAIATGRILLIDTRLSGLADRLSFYMTPRQGWGKQIRELVDADWAHLNRLSCYPTAIEGRLDLLPHIFLASLTTDPNHRLGKRAPFKHMLRLSRYLRHPSDAFNPVRRFALAAISMRTKLLPLDFQCIAPCEADVVVHHASGGGQDSVHTLAMMMSTEFVAATLQAKLNRLQKPFDAIHIRHTDYQTDYELFLNQLAPKLTGKRVLVCSDNAHVLHYARDVLHNIELIGLDDVTLPVDAALEMAAGKTFDTASQTSPETSPETSPATSPATTPNSVRPAHYHWHLPLDQRRARNVRMLTDLMALSHAEQLHYAPVSRAGWTGHSGFAILAQRLSVDKHVRDAWLGSGVGGV